jgi:6-pyruvoyl-tetrahydropterin synthase
MHLPVELHGQPGRVAALTPLSVDGMVVAASMMQAISARHHGHSYRVEVAITTSGPLSPPGFATDFAELASFGDHLAGAYDHRDLNTVLDAPPTSENLARTLFDWCAAPLRSPAVREPRRSWRARFITGGAAAKARSGRSRKPAWSQRRSPPAARRRRRPPEGTRTDAKDPERDGARQADARWVDNVALERQFPVDHPGSVIERLPADPDRALLIRFAGRLGEHDGSGEVTGTELGHVLLRLEQLAAGHARPMR